MSVNHTHVEISQLIFLRGESFPRHSAASHASITLEALVSGGLGKLWVTPRSASIYKTCLARVFPSQHSDLSVPCISRCCCSPGAPGRHWEGEECSVLRQHPGMGSQPPCAAWLKAFFILINTLLELCGLPSSTHLFRSGEQTLNIERYVSQNQSCVNLQLPHLNNWGMDPAECLVYMEYR